MNIEQYIQALQSFDWYYKFSDDRNTLTIAQEKLAKISKAQKEVDPDMKLWDQYCPKDSGVFLSNQNPTYTSEPFTMEYMVKPFPKKKSIYQQLLDMKNQK